MCRNPERAFARSGFFLCSHGEFELVLKDEGFDLLPVTHAHLRALESLPHLPPTEQPVIIPADPFLDAALQRDATLLEYAFSRNVVLATPATLIALLRTVAYAWRQEALARNAVAVHTLGRELYSRLSTMGSHLAKLGASLAGAVGAYNKAVGSLESRVLVSARKFAELGISDDELETPAQVEVTPRQLQSPELADELSADELSTGGLATESVGER